MCSRQSKEPDSETSAEPPTEILKGETPFETPFPQVKFLFTHRVKLLCEVS
jgi:hypothetical protein